MVKRISVRPRLEFVGGGRGVACHVGALLLADLADNVGLARALSEAMADTKVRRRGHDRGRVLADAAVMVADGGELITSGSISPPTGTLEWSPSTSRRARFAGSGAGLHACSYGLYAAAGNSGTASSCSHDSTRSTAPVPANSSTMPRNSSVLVAPPADRS